jgi:hypothetical protein
MKKILLVIIGLLLSAALYSQSIGIGNSDFIPSSSAALEIRSNNKGLLIPRMSFSDKNAISNPSNGLLLYQTDEMFGFYYYNGTKWELLGTNLNDKDFDPTNEIQIISILNDEIFLSNGGGSITLPAGTIGAQKLVFKGSILSIDDGNSVDLASLKDDLGDHKATKNIILLSHYISGDGDDEGISISSDGDVVFSNALTVKGDVNLKAGSINSSEIQDAAITSAKILDNSITSIKIADGAVVTSKIGDSQITANKLSSMNASTDNVLRWDGSVWTPSNIGGILNYKGVWSAQFNTPVITSSMGIKGDFYIVSNTGNQNLGAGPEDYYAGDWILFNGSAWERVDHANTVSSIFGRKGVVTSEFGDYSWAQIDKKTSLLSDLSEVFSSTPISGNVLIGNGSGWQSKNIDGDLSIDLNGNTLVLPKKITYNKLQDAIGSKGTVLVWNGVQWDEFDMNPLYTDEFQDIQLSSSNVLGLSNSTEKTDLSKFLDNTDSQDLDLVGNDLRLSNDVTSVNLSKYLDDTDDQDLSLNGSVLSITDGNSVNFLNLLNSRIQSLSLSNNILSITGATSPVNLSNYLDNTDSQSLILNPSNDLKITGAASIISLTKFLDNTDNQELSFVGGRLYITGSTKSIDLSVLSNGVSKVFGRVGEITAQSNDYTWEQIDKRISSINDISDINSSDLTSANILISDGSKWNSKTIIGDITVSNNGLSTIGASKITNVKLAANSVESSKIKNGAITYSKLQAASGGANTVLLWNGISWLESDLVANDNDRSAFNELQKLELTGNDLSITLSSDIIDLKGYLDNTDNQELVLNDKKLSIVRGNEIDLSSFASTDSQQIGLSGTSLTLDRSTSVNLTSFMQNIALNTLTNSLSITGGTTGFIDLTPYKDNTDNQDLILNGNTLSITNVNTNTNSSVDLGAYMDNTDNQELSISGHSLSIEGGNSISLVVADNQNLALANNILSLSRGLSDIDLSIYNQSLSLTATSLSISNSNSIDLSKINTDKQELSLSGTDLSITNGNSINVVSLKDNLGNHTATENIVLGANWLSNDNTDKGLSIASSGNVTINKNLQVDGALSANLDVLVSGAVSIGGSADASAVLSISSTSKGVLIPRMNTSERNLITTPATGLMIYNTETKSFNYFDGVSWNLVGGNDNLGNHTASKNIKLSSHYLSNDGDNEGLSIDNIGKVIISGESSVGKGMLIGTGGLSPSAILELESTTKGFLPSRMSTAERKDISPEKGLMVFDNELNSLFIYNGTKWVSADATDNTWNISGNTIDESTDFIGSINGADVIIKTQNAEVLRVTKDSRVSIGTPDSDVHTSAKLEVNSISKGFLPPRMTTLQRKNITGPANGLVVFDTDRNNLYIYKNKDTGMWSEIGVPIGSIHAFLGTVVPEGWLLCDGSSFILADYPKLYAILGGTTLPDLQNMELKGSTTISVNYIIRAK